MASLLGQCCTCSPSFISWTNESQKVPNINYLMCVIAQSSQDWKCDPQSLHRYGAWHYYLARERLSSLAWLCLSLQFRQHCNGLIRVDGLPNFQEIQKDHLFPIPKDHITFTHLRVLSWTFIQWGNHMSPLHAMLFSLWLVVMMPCLVTGNDKIPETVSFSLILVQ